MLPWKIESVRPNTACPKDHEMVVKPSKGIAQVFETVCIMDITSGQVAKFKERADCLHHFIWHVAFNCW